MVPPHSEILQNCQLQHSRYHFDSLPLISWYPKHHKHEGCSLQCSLHVPLWVSWHPCYFATFGIETYFEVRLSSSIAFKNGSETLTSLTRQNPCQKHQWNYWQRLHTEVPTSWPAPKQTKCNVMNTWWTRYNGPTQLWLVWLVSSSGNFAGLEDVLSTKCSNVSSLQKVWPNNLSKN